MSKLNLLAAVKEKLRLRKRIKKKKPDFVRQESWRYKRLKTNWRRPKGLDNKMRRKVKGWPPTVSTGYRSPKSTRNLHPSGYKEFLVYNVDDLKKVNPETHAVRIAHTVGKRKRTEILVESRKMKIMLLNLKESKLDEASDNTKEELKEEKTQTKTNELNELKESKKENIKGELENNDKS